MSNQSQAAFFKAKKSHTESPPIYTIQPIFCPCADSTLPPCRRAPALNRPGPPGQRPLPGATRPPSVPSLHSRRTPRCLKEEAIRNKCIATRSKCLIRKPSGWTPHLGGEESTNCILANDEGRYDMSHGLCLLGCQSYSKLTDLHVPFRISQGRVLTYTVSASLSRTTHLM